MAQRRQCLRTYDPLGCLLDLKAPRRPIHHPPLKLLDNLLERLDNGKKARFTWDLYDRLTRYEDDRLTADFAYDALGRRVAKYSKAHYLLSPGAGPAWIEQQQRTLNAQYDCGRNIYGWDGDNLAYASRPHETRRPTRRNPDPPNLKPINTPNLHTPSSFNTRRWPFGANGAYYDARFNNAIQVPHTAMHALR
ncbi:hypothetical protein [Pseudomonas sp. PS01297]|uniref:hypothetical protein n=1 Tax=Pseudomonas sp. PS01297 TaxID=2991433 RepID=UPI00249B12AD|nr:hypothetical protein [Pseudomonas sp. PS01297]